MQLLVAHQILVAAAVALAAVFCVRSMALFARGGGLGELGLGVASLLIGAALAVYLRGVRARWLAQKQAGDR